jgi:hypothetical protein
MITPKGEEATDFNGFARIKIFLFSSALSVRIRENPWPLIPYALVKVASDLLPEVQFMQAASLD